MATEEPPRFPTFPVIVLLVLIGLMVVEGDYTELTRLDFFSEPIVPAGHEAAH